MRAGCVRSTTDCRKIADAERVKPSYFGFLGRIAPEKGVDRAIHIAKAAGIPIKIAAKVDKVDREYFEEKIKPQIDGTSVQYIGEITDADKSEFLSGAVGLLVPIDWPEPFGLVMIEAMACGTPVIAFNRGSVPEIIEDGVNGFIVEDEQGAIGAAYRLPELSREENPRLLRGALHGAPHGAGLSRCLSQLDGAAGATLETRGRQQSLPWPRPTSLGGPGFGNEQQHRGDRDDRDRPKAEECELAADVIGHDAGERGAHGRATAGCHADDAKRGIKAAGAASDIRHDQGHHDAEHRGADAVQKLNGDDHGRIGEDGKQQSPDRERGKSEKQERAPPPDLRLTSDPGRNQRDDQLRHNDAGGDQDGGPIAQTGWSRRCPSAAAWRRWPDETARRSRPAEISGR